MVRRACSAYHESTSASVAACCSADIAELWLGNTGNLTPISPSFLATSADSDCIMMHDAIVEADATLWGKLGTVTRASPCGTQVSITSSQTSKKRLPLL